MEILRVVDVYRNALNAYRFIEKSCAPPLKFLINEYDRNLNVSAEVLKDLQQVNRPKIIGGRMDWIRQLCLIRLFGDSTPLQILLAECSRWNSAVGAG